MNTSNAEPGRPINPATLRMRRWRDRKRKGLRVLQLEIRKSEIAALVRQGFLNAGNVGNDAEITNAIYAFLEDRLDNVRVQYG